MTELTSNQLPVEQESPIKQHTSGYMDSTYHWNSPEEPAQQEAPQPIEQLNADDLDEYAKKLGINPDELGKSEEELRANEPPLSPDDWYSQQFGTAEAKQFADNFKKHLGLDIKEVYELINSTANVTKGLEQWRQQVQNERDLGLLKQEFGNEFDSIMPGVKAEFDRIKSVNPRQAAALDNIDGVRYLAAYIRQREGGITQSTSMNTTDIPQFDYPNVRRRPGGGNSNAPVIRMSEFLKWSDDDVQRRYQEVVQAKQNGTFIYDL